MPRQLTNSLFNSLRGRIWISTSVLAFFICTFGLISYLVVTLLVNDVFYGILIPFLLLAFLVVIFGWWLSNEIVGPIEKVTLLSKSLERTSSTSIPKTSGSYETDQLLQTLFKNSQQVQVLVTMMEKVANGNLDVSMKPLEGSDRLSATFQKLLIKVSESISAKEDLDKLQASVNRLKREVSPIRSGNLSVSISGEDAQTKDISASINYLVENLSQIIDLTRSDSNEVAEISLQIEKQLRTLADQDEARTEELSQASIALKQIPNLVKKISDDLGSASQSANQSIEKVQKGNQLAAQNAEAVSRLRKQMREAIKRVQSLNERTQEIGKVAAAVEDLANRTNMVALNASIQATELGEKGQGFALVAEEVERLAARANGTNRQISALNKSVATEIRKVENSLELAGGEISGFSKYSIENSSLLAELERYVGHFLNLQGNLVSIAADRSEESEQAFLKFVNSISESKATIEGLRTSGSDLSNLSNLMRNLQVAVSEYRISLPERETETEETQENSGMNHENPPAPAASPAAVEVPAEEPLEAVIAADADEPEDLGISQYYGAAPDNTRTNEKR